MRAVANEKARPAPSPSPYFVPVIPHIRIELRQALFSYQDYSILLLTLAGRSDRAARYLPQASRVRSAIRGRPVA